MQKLVTKLMSFGFTKTDALVYINLLKNGQASGYKIAKDISLSRSSVYSSIDNLVKNGYIFLSNGDTKEYQAKSPDLIFSEIEKKTYKNISILKKELSKMVQPNEQEFIYNLVGYENSVQQAKALIEQAKAEIYLNTDFRLNEFKQEICEGINRGVRIIGFSFNRIEKPHEKMELFSRSDTAETLYPAHRFMLVVDMEKALIFSHRTETRGVYTNNRLMVKMTAEHIHNDIYLTEYEKHCPIDPIRIYTIHEKTNDMVLDEKKNNKK